MIDKCEKGCKFCCTKVENLTAGYNKEVVINNISFHLHCNEITVLVGKNGSGKSTLLKAILKEIPYTGKISFSSKHSKTKNLTIGYVPQNINIQESPMSVYDFVAIFLTNKPSFLIKDKKLYNKIMEHMKEFKIEDLLDERLSTLSGGQLQRVMIALAVMPYPELLILDEPLSSIDIEGRENFYKLICDIKEKHDIAILLVSHDFSDVKKYADKVILINKEVLKIGSPSEVFESQEFKKELGMGV